MKRSGAAPQFADRTTSLSSAIDPSTLPIPPGQPTRCNPYMAPVGDPVRARLLMSTDQYRVSWIHLEPECVFSLKTYSPTTVTIENKKIPSVRFIYT